MMSSIPPDRTLKGVGDQSQLFRSLKVYLNNKSRLQPIIGLSCVIECVRAGSREVVYLCEVCKCRLGKNDAKNHIMGSLHRYNYIRVRYPHFVSEWKSDADLSKMARPLMEMAQMLERREGAGNIQVLELDGATYAELTANSESHAMTLPRPIRTGQQLDSQSDDPAAPPERPAGQSERIVLPPQKRSVQPEVVVRSPMTTTDAGRPDDGQDSFPGISGQSETPDSGEPPNAVVQSEVGEEDLHGYAGDEPLIGLTCVVECRSELDGPPYCFLCRCCDAKTAGDDIIGHLTNPYHRFNYMMKYHGECLEGMKAGPDIGHHLQSAARKLEREEGRGRVQVMRLSSPLCSQMAVNSYQWCVDMLKFGFSEASDAGAVKQNRADIPGTGRDATKVKDRGGASLKRRAPTPPSSPRQRDPAGSGSEVKRGKKKEEEEERPAEACCEPVFKVSLSLTGGPLLLERTSFSRDPPYVEPAPPPTAATPDLSPSPSSPPSLPISSETDRGAMTPSPSDAPSDGRYVSGGENAPGGGGGLANVSVTLSVGNSAHEERGEGPTEAQPATTREEGPSVGHPYHSGERLASNQYHSTERLASNPYHSGERLASDWYHSGERLDHDRYRSREAAFDGEGEWIVDGEGEGAAGDGRYRPGDAQTDRLHRVDESATAARLYTEEEELYREEIRRGVGLTVEVMRTTEESEEAESYWTQSPHYPTRSEPQYHTQRRRDYRDVAAAPPPPSGGRDVDFRDPVAAGYEGVYRADAAYCGDAGGGPRRQFYEMRYRAEWGGDRGGARPPAPPEAFRGGYEPPPGPYPPQPHRHGMTPDPYYYAVSDGFGTDPDLDPRGFRRQPYVRAQTQGFGPPVFWGPPDLGRPPDLVTSGGGFLRPPPSQPYLPRDPGVVGYADPPRFNPAPPDHPSGPPHYLGHAPPPGPWAPPPGLPGPGHAHLVHRLF